MKIDKSRAYRLFENLYATNGLVQENLVKPSLILLDKKQEQWIYLFILLIKQM